MVLEVVDIQPTENFGLNDISVCYKMNEHTEIFGVILVKHELPAGSGLDLSASPV